MTLILPSAPNIYNVQDQVQLRLALMQAINALSQTTTVTAPQITADQNDYSLKRGDRIRLSSDAGRTITGLAGGAADRELWLVNVGSFDITLANESASSAANNRIVTSTGADIVMAANDVVHAWYDGISGRWRVFSHY